MSKKKLMLAAASVSVLALYTTAASAQATPAYDTPAQARTYSETSDAVSGTRLNRIVRDRRGFEPFAAAPRAGEFYQPPVRDKHTGSVSDY